MTKADLIAQMAKDGIDLPPQSSTSLSVNNANLENSSLSVGCK